ncbi:GTPase Obg [Maioricimonas rarisocia]|uniref:GTPase Obg n=1 Tax=Maioricimonas rarisocia TaxID=2528026 RepID=A0A517Z8C9_9PLAN|nr:GTPase [Maioricimonas rarisocia]QDU38725.1 GTPase Obg [Maioricimonas rarisocia]
MPANLTPQYQKAEEEYRRAQSPQERVACLERMLQLIPKHKGTEKLQADLKSRLKEARESQQEEKSSQKGGKRYRIPRQGAGTVIVLGPPNSGKSRILAELTNAEPEVAPYPYSTREPMPAMMTFEDVTIQLIDTPPVSESHLEPYLVGFVRSADLVLLCFDGSSDDAPDETAAVLEQFAARKTVLDAHSGFDEDDYSVVHVNTRLLVTRGDDPDVATRLELFREVVALPFAVDRVELERAESVESLRRTIYDALGVARIYTKRPGKPADYDAPFTIPRGGLVEDLAGKIHRELADSLKFARVWRDNELDGQTVGRDFPLCDRDVVELHA